MPFEELRDMDASKENWSHDGMNYIPTQTQRNSS